VRSFLQFPHFDVANLSFSFRLRSHFTNVTNGITARRWLLQCNPTLAALITETLGSDRWVTHLDELKGLEKFAKDKAFKKKWAASKQG
jgi:starch phosphorylase